MNLSKGQVRAFAQARGLEEIKTKPKKCTTVTACAKSAGMDRRSFYDRKDRWAERGLPFPTWGKGQRTVVCEKNFGIWINCVELIEFIEDAAAENVRSELAGAVGAMGLPDGMEPRDFNQLQQGLDKQLEVMRKRGELVPLSRLKDHLAVASSAINEAIEQAFASSERDAAENNDQAVKSVRKLKGDLLTRLKEGHSRGQAELRQSYLDKPDA